MLWQEYCAAVFIRLDGSFVSSDLHSLVHDIYFIHSDERSHYRHSYGCICNYERFCSLACYLTQVFTCDQHIAACVFCDFLSDPHHESSY